ncbi:MAG: glycosyltransferase family 4 protein [Pseudomonadota bacterium]
MKICFVGLENLPVLAPEYGKHGIGGEQVQHTLMAKALARRGHEVTMVVADYGQADGAVWQGVKTYKAYALHAGLPVLRYIHPRWTGLWRALARADADLYYVSCAGMQVGLVAMFCQRHGRQFVYKIAHDKDCEPDDLLIQYARDKKLYEYGLRRAGAIIAQSEQQQAAMLANYKLSSTVAHMMVDGTDRVRDYAERDIDVLWVNNLRQFKRPDLALSLARLLPNLNIHMIGGAQAGFTELYDSIRAEAATLSNLTFHGRLPYHDMDRMYAQARVFINTSDTEGFPNSYLQAWIRGTPVVAFFDPDALNQRHGLGVTPATLEDMAAAVAQLHGDRTVWEACSARCTAFMEEFYGDDKILAPYMARFADLAP